MKIIFCKASREFPKFKAFIEPWLQKTFVDLPYDKETNPFDSFCELEIPEHLILHHLSDPQKQEDYIRAFLSGAFYASTNLIQS